ncbi:uncharacterized protein LOC125658631 [Ostrea edulis]|uniref:uncharacterized protein LOC125658631 n=1 Tax=Ostrea edulis TaxID=37623 RepID=UPI0024AEACAA|nr:uncharacterized protein LOC125658631 [Ostrea edulis]
MSLLCSQREPCARVYSIFGSFTDSLRDSTSVTPTDNAYRNVTQMRNMIRKNFPLLVVKATTREDVKETIAFARQYNLQLTVYGTGHDNNGRSTGNDTIQLNLSLMKDKVVDLNSSRHGNGTISVGPGNTWMEVYREVDKHGRVIVGSSTQTVGIGGFTLGGGHSPICRYYGMAIDNLLEVEMVMADGRIVTATNDSVHTIYNNGSTSNVTDTDFFWAVAGGGGGTFGVATRFLFKLHTPPEKIIRVVLIYPIYSLFNENIFAQVFSKMKELFTEDLPHEWGGFMEIDGLDNLFGAKGHFAFVLNHLGSKNTASYRYLESLFDFLPKRRYFDSKVFSTFLDYEKGIIEKYPYYLTFGFNSLISESNLTTELRDYLIQSVLEKHTTYSKTTYIATLIGGKMREVGTESTSVHPGFRSALFSMSGNVAFGVHGIPEVQEIHEKSVQINFEFAKFGNGMYPNEAGECTPDWQKNFWGSNYDRLYQIKLREDPDVFFTCDQCVGSELRQNESTSSCPIPSTSTSTSSSTPSSTPSSTSSVSSESQTTASAFSKVYPTSTFTPLQTENSISLSTEVNPQVSVWLFLSLLYFLSM